MSTSEASTSEAIPLTAADCFLRAVDAEVRHYNGSSHSSQLVLRLGPGFDAEAFSKTIRELVPFHPLLGARIRRRFGLGAPAYRTDSPARADSPGIHIHDADGPRQSGEAADHEIFARRMNQILDIRNGELLHFDVVRYAGGTDGTDLAMTWIHMLFDGSGSENFLRFVDECVRGVRRVDELPSDEFGSADPSKPPDPRPRASERGQRALTWLRYLRGLTKTPPHSLSGPLQRVPQDLRHRVHRFSKEESEVIQAEAKRSAGFLTPMLFYLAATIRAHHAVFTARGVDPGSYLIPLPVNIRPKGAEKAIFRTHISMLWFQVMPDGVDDFDALVETLKSQRRESIKGGMIENGKDAMDLVRQAPSRLYAHMTRRDFGGEISSFFFAYTGEFLAGMDTFLGSEIQSAYHVPPVPVSPGSCAAMSLRDDRLSVTHVAQNGLFTSEELRIFDGQLRRDLLRGA